MTSGRILRGWLVARPVKDSLLLRGRIAWGDLDSAEATVWQTWFFGEPPPPPSGPSIVQAVGAAVYGSTISVTFPAPVTPGNSIVVLFDNATSYNAPPAGCSDDQGNAYTLDATLGPERHGYGDDYTVYVYRAHAVTHAAQTVGVSFVGGVSHAANIYAFEISGLADAPPADTFSASLATGAGGTISLTATQARSVSLGAVRTAGGYSVTPSGGASVIYPYAPPVFEFGVWRNNTAAGDASLSFTLSAAATKALFGVLYEGAAAGGGPVQGSLSSTLAGATASASAALAIRGQAAATLGVLTASGSAGLALRAQGAATLDAAMLSASGALGALGIGGALAVTLAQATAAATGALAIRGQGAAALTGATLSASGALAIGGQVAAALAAVTSAATGSLAIRAQASVTLADATAGGAGQLAIGAQAASVLEAATLLATGALAVRGQGAATLSGATLAATGSLPIRAQASVTLADATGAGAGALRIRAQGAAALDDALSAGEAALALAAQMTAGHLEAATCAAAGALALTGSGAALLGEATCAGAATVSDPGLSLAAIEALAAAVWAQPLPLPDEAPPYVPGPGTLSAAEIARAVHSIWARTLP